ncbi:hypothetical protein [Mucilaginibacter auburnensis]|uniref:Fibronectin type-III domain-containing protein n=1 Tax=Mucilaginibacter auburnensis TaxID=1457233 RepID=A0A2H9VML2_9SPHI|nr:hypothetical protein [Mucilaginibacter auburnensis]PJJ79571.1 hypothetical protein CLV57_2705 [Mucilaginibacter auburnensis]
MKKYITIVFMTLLTSAMFSCKKDADVAGTEAKLPAIQLSSLGYNQVGPFTIAAASATPTTPATVATVLQLYFGATTTGVKSGKFTVEFFEGTSISATAVPVKTVTFSSWTGYDDTSDPTKKPTPVLNHSINYTLQSTTYEKTQVYGGNMLIKLGLLGLTAGKTYSVRATAYSEDGKTSVLSQTSFFKTI